MCIFLNFIVRTDRETAEMIKAYVTTNFDRNTSAFSGPLIIYPSNDSVQEPGSAGLRNRPDLHVEVSSQAIPFKYKTEASPKMEYFD